MKKKGRKIKRYNRKPKKFPPVEGVLMCSKNGRYGFVVTDNDEPDIYVQEEYFRGAVHKDRVLCRQISGKNKKGPEGIITEIIARSQEPVKATVYDSMCGNLILYADNRCFYPEIIVSEEDSLGAKPGDKVITEIFDYPRRDTVYATVVKNLGKSSDIKTDIEAIIYNHNIKDIFDEETLKECAKINDSITDNDIEGRLDLRGEKIFTIDGDDAKDFDDAVSIRKLPGGSYKLGVHIADVSHYVRFNSPTDTEAFTRGTSVYLPDRVIPMLPEKLSNGVCSLLPNKDRLTLSCIMTINSNGKVIRSVIKKSVIRSVHRMTYSNVQKIIDNDKKLSKEYKDILTPLMNMNDLADILIKKRSERGCIDFDLPEAKAILDKNLIPTEITVQNRLKSHRIIEEFMLLANETIAKFAKENKLPFVYRTHAAPDFEKLSAFNRFLTGFNMSIHENLEKGVSPLVFSKLLDEIKGWENEAIISKYMLRTMMKASYSTENSGHFGLALRDYCHFTSPIRRYPDLTVHRILTAYIENKSLKRYFSHAALSAENSQVTEIKAEECERDTATLMKVIYISSYIGTEFDAQISSITDFGIYAELDNTIEGMIRLSSINNDYYKYDEERNILIGKRKRRVFAIGDKIRIKVASANKELLQIDFVLVE